MIVTRDLRKTYVLGGATVRALDGVSLEIDRGEMVAITGPSGSGKSTLMHILGCLDQPDEGEYILDGQAVEKLGRDALAAVPGSEVVVYPEADHGFIHDPTRPAHRADDAQDAWARMLAFLD